MQKAYSRINWENYPSDATPINETNLNRMDSALNEIDNRIISQDTLKATKEEVADLVENITFTESTGVITVTKKNGSQINIDTKLEKIAVNFEYDATTQQIILNLIDGTKQYIDLSELVTQYEFLPSNTIVFTAQEDGKIKAEVLDGSINESKLQPNYLADIRVETSRSSSYMASAEASAMLSQSWAIGETGVRAGEDTNNSKYYAELSDSARNEARECANLATNSIEEMNRKLSMTEFDVDNNGNLTYTENTAYVFTVDVSGNLLWEVG